MQYILTDGKEIFKVKDMTQEEAEDANKNASEATDGNVSWAPVDWNKHLKMAQDIIQSAKLSVKVEVLEEGGLEFDGWITIGFEERENVRSSIRGETVTLEPRFIVEVAVVQHNYPHEPDDVDISEIGNHFHIEKAIGQALLTTVEFNLNNIIESIGMAKYVIETIEEEKAARDEGVQIKHLSEKQRKKLAKITNEPMYENKAFYIQLPKNPEEPVLVLYHDGQEIGKITLAQAFQL